MSFFKNIKLKFIWLLGHCAVIYFSLMSWSLFFDVTFYSRALVCVCWSYGVVIYNSFQKIEFNLNFVAKVLANENVNYWLLSFVLLSTPSMPSRFKLMIAFLLPFVVYSLVHCLNALKNPTLNQTVSKFNVASNVALIEIFNCFVLFANVIWFSCF